MKEYTPKQIKKLEANPYTLKVTKNKLYFTIKFKEDFWINYQAGNAPRKILSDLGYDLEYAANTAHGMAKCLSQISRANNPDIIRNGSIFIRE